MNELSPVAQSQLAAWEAIARDWMLVPAIRVPEDHLTPLQAYVHLVCWHCDMSVYHVGKQSISPAVLLTVTVAHLRNVHRNLDPDA